MAVDKPRYVLSPEELDEVVELFQQEMRAKFDLAAAQGVAQGLRSPKTSECDVCYGTGRFKGFGGPCSEGCPTKGEK